ncbi:MAG TPA: D-alanyl-D-alanine carboxypeptidase/D-alanyl-D-alanine-endopeptidase [Micromonosporaceae bacterium]|nr:D-alanyl-D-alanine carboxypeptidase/D-alanyl-D-alanine-endopeptidase [Micromonosporaceae bacterium]
MPRQRTTPYGPIIALSCVVVLGLALVAIAVVRPGPVDGWLGGGAAHPTPVAEPSSAPPSAVLAGASADAPEPTEAGVKAALDPLVRDSRLGGRVSVSVVDVVTGSSLYARGPDTAAVPASTTKLVTAVTVLASRGPTYKIVTKAVAGAHPGEVVLVGGGDPTLAAGATGTYPGAARLDLLAAAAKQALGGTPPTKVIIDGSLFSGPSWGPAWDTELSEGYGAATMALTTDGARVHPKEVKPPAARYREPDVAAGRLFAAALGLPASAVAAGTAPPAVAAPAVVTSGSAASAGPVTLTPGVELGRVESPPLVRIVEMMLTESDNVIAESLARQVALAKGQPASYAGAAAAMKTVLADLGLAAAQDGLADGSGLSKNNRITPALLTAVLTLAARSDHPELHGLFSGLPVAGYSGTLKDRYRSAGPSRPGAGVVRAKTGTLTGVSAISGIVVTRDGRLLAFAVLADDVTPGGQFPAQDALDKITTTLAGCGCR